MGKFKRKIVPGYFPNPETQRYNKREDFEDSTQNLEYYDGSINDNIDSETFFAKFFCKHNHKLFKPDKNSKVNN